MTGHAQALIVAAGSHPSYFGWWLGWIIGIVIVLVVVALVVPILLLARSIGDEATKINDSLTQAVHNTALIPQVADGVEAVLAEGLKHHLFLGRVLGKVKT
jgi:hypothetical protein